MQLNKILLYPNVFHEENLLKAPVREPFADNTLEFLNDVSKVLMKDSRAKAFSDIITLGFWIRRSNTVKLKQDFYENHVRQPMLGKGVVFHIAPGNVAVNFAYSLFTSMFAGNNNIVKLAPRDFEQTDIILSALKQVCELPAHQEIAQGLTIVKYAIDDEATSYFSSLCDARIMWGGDQTVAAIRKYPLPPRSTEIMFADRYSLCAIKSREMLAASDVSLKQAASGFFNDTFLMDQNACSSPRMVVWQGEPDKTQRAKEKFWAAVYSIVKENYPLEPVLAIDKYTCFLQTAINYEKVKLEKGPDNRIVRINVDDLPDCVDNIRCAGGYFLETTVSSLDEIAHVVNKKYQTLTYFGFGREELFGFVTRNSLKGIDRIVPFGKALEFALVWDGYDLITDLSRICSIF